MFSLLVYLLVVFIVLGFVWWAIGALGIPEPLARIARVILILIALIFAIYLLLSLVGQAPPLHMR